MCLNSKPRRWHSLDDLGIRAWMLLGLGAVAVTAMNSAHADIRLGAALGYQHWQGISDLRPVTGGRFESGGFALDASVHWRVQRFEHRRIMIGLQAGGGADYSSDIEAFVGDLRASTSYVASSAIIAVADNGFVEVGAGSYRVTMRDSRVLGQTDMLPPGSPVSKVHEQREAGYFVGGGFEFESGERFALTVGAKLHFPGFGGVPQLGPGAGQLDKPMIALQFGVRYLF